MPADGATLAPTTGRIEAPKHRFGNGAIGAPRRRRRCRLAGPATAAPVVPFPAATPVPPPTPVPQCRRRRRGRRAGRRRPPAREARIMGFHAGKPCAVRAILQEKIANSKISETKRNKVYMDNLRVGLKRSERQLGKPPSAVI
jgi:hypothetical protein